MAEGALSTEALMKRGDERFAASSNFFNTCQAKAEIFYPERADFVSQGVDGAERYRDIFAGEPALLRERLGSGIGVLTRRADQKWFNGKILPRQIGKLDRVKRWCEGFTEVQRDEIYSPLAQFDRAMREGDHDYVTFGEHILWHGWGKNGDRGRLLFQTKHLRDCAYVVNEYGIVDEMHENITDKTYEQWARLFSKVGASLPASWTRKLRDNPTAAAIEKPKVRRVVLPAERYSEQGYVKGKGRDMAFACVYIAADDKHEIHCDAFRVFPYLVRRWSTVSGETRGRSPCTGVALADSRILNVAQRSILESMEKAVDPTLILPHDGIIGDVELFAGGRVMVDAAGAYKPTDMIGTLPVGDVKLGLEFTERRRMFLAEALYANLLKRLPDKEMTAFEADQWLDDYVTMAAPVLLPMRADNAILMEAVFQRLMHARRFEEPPEEVYDAEASFEFEDPLQQAVRRQKTQRASQAVGFAKELTEAGQGDKMDNIDWDKVTRDAVEGIADGMDWLIPEEERDEAREARAMEEAAKAAAALAMQEQQRQDGLAGLKPGADVNKPMADAGLPTPQAGPEVLLNAGA